MKSLILAVTLAILAVPAMAQDHSGHAMPADASAATTAFEEANTRMHENMVMEFTGDPDVDFIKSMIPHHQGAVDMAKIALQYGKDPEVKALAEKIIAAQEEEIAWMQDWLAKHGQ